MLIGQKLYLEARLRSAEALQQSVLKKLKDFKTASVEDIEVSNDVTTSEEDLDEDVDHDDHTQEREKVLVAAFLSSSRANDVDD